jgi:hypothetical protein
VFIVIGVVVRKSWRSRLQERLRLGQPSAYVDGGHEAIVANLAKAGRQDMEQKPSHKLHASEGDLVASPGPKAYALALEGQEPAVGDGHSVGVATEISDDLGRTGEGALGMDDPAGAVKAVLEVGPGHWMS